MKLLRLCLTALTVALGSFALANAGELNLTDWKRVPVFESKNMSGRIEPLDSFARQALDDICQIAKGDVKLGLSDYVDPPESGGAADFANSEYAPALKLFPDGKIRSIPPAELVLSWMAEPDAWEVVPFLHAPHKDVRELIGVPERNGRGLHLKYVSPKQVFESEGFRKYLRDMQQREAGQKMTETDKLVQELLERYQRYRAITLNPSLPLTAGLISPPGGRRQFLSQLNDLIRMAESPGESSRPLLSTLQEFAQLPDERLSQAAARTYNGYALVREAGGKLVSQWFADAEGATEAGVYDTGLKLDDVRPAVMEFHAATVALAEVINEHRDRLFDKAAELSDSQLASLGPLFRELADKSRELRIRAYELNIALYEDGNCLRVVPALNAGALTKKRDPQVKSHPWLSLGAVMYGDELLKDYPPAKVAAVRSAWESLAAAYRDRDASDREAQVASSAAKFYESLKELGNAVEPLREELVKTQLAADERDAAIMHYTRWPDAFGLNRIQAELDYNRIDPFGRSWVISLIALACFALSFGVLKRPMFIAAVVILCLNILWTAYGFYLRVYVTQWAPVTNMYETVVWVAFCVSILGAWFLLLPLAWQGIKDAWRLTAFPFSFEAAALDKWQLAKLPEKTWLVANMIVAVPRIMLMAWVFYFLAIDTSYSDGQRTVFDLLPNIAATGGSPTEMAQQIITWAVSFLCLVLSVWFVPRVAFTTLASLVFIPWDWVLRRGPELNKLGAEVHARWPIAVGATVMSAFGAWVTWMAPSVLDESFSPLQPVLRSNFWLTVHVLTIVSSYSAGMLALGIGLIALTYYLFGRYRDPVVLTHVPAGMRPASHDEPDGEQFLARRPPEQVGVLAGYAYRAIQVAVLLLATGTILGGIWADRSWGRFWGWDPKEVWALVSLLVYLAILHGRFAGWFNNFGLIFGTVIGATAILMSWYGVNFVLPKLAPDGQAGLHSYGSGSGGFAQVMGFVVVIWIYQLAATVRYVKETTFRVAPVKEDAEVLLGTAPKKEREKVS